MKILLIALLVNMANGQYQDFVIQFDTMEECQVRLVEARKAVPPRPGWSFVLACIAPKPTDGTEI